ncbi:chloroplast RNA-polymerase sigma factor precursor [Ectocarpus siliculosus]|uniref:Chloroplast RNA-polymerase sigma factor n=1 Tax=Ectocarpus siliculosus TaxID=2880 RepID=D8LNI4_ECTSI|nr:chloroplast RNA-polymerase sigma factor precursor [Ectocarpus siliculosus]|eukprot:CBN79859.1 chloroplast RNA-polymerase sigma factor precursor [Ectocarpus siliculosus]
MCASAPPRTQGFAPPGSFGRAHGAGDSFYCAERRLAATSLGESTSAASTPGRRERRAAAAVSRCSMASSSRKAAARPGVAARSGAARAAASATRKRGRDRVPPSSSSAGVAVKDRAATDVGAVDKQSRARGAGSQATAPTAAAKGGGGGGGGALANPPPPAKGFRRKNSGGGGKKKKTTAAAAAESKAGAAGGVAPPSKDVSPSVPAVTVSAPSSSLSSSSSSDANPLNVYFKTLKKIKLLKPDEEVVLGRQIQRGLQLERVRDRLETTHGAAPSCEEWASTLHLTKDELLRELAVADEAKEHMISANLRLVVSMARGYRGRGLAFPDLIQEGTMGLVKACEKFNPEMGFQFYTYARWWIKKSILTGIANQSRVIRLPTQVHAFLSSIRKYTYELTVDGKVPTDEELGDKLGATVEKIQHYRQAALRTDSISLDIRASNKVSDGAADDLGTQIGEKSTPDPEDATQAFYMKGKVTALLATLKDREQKVVRARYGLDGATSKTLEEIGRDLGLTRERVRQIESKALSKLRQPYRNYRVREHKVGQIFVDAGLREPASEAVAAARALIAEAEGLEAKQRQPAINVDEGGAAGGLAAAGDRPLKIEFKAGVDASESTQAVEAVLVAALDRAPATEAVPAKRESGGRSGSKKAAAVSAAAVVAPSKRKADEVKVSGHPADEETNGLRVEGSEKAGRVGAGLELPALAVTPAGKLDVESKRRLADRGESTHVGATIRLGAGLDAAGGGDAHRSNGGGQSDSPAAAAAVLSAEEQRALEIESKRKSLNKAWNKKSEAAVDRLERELAQSAAALAMLEGEQEEWERSVGRGVEEKSLSLASL